MSYRDNITHYPYAPAPDEDDLTDCTCADCAYCVEIERRLKEGGWEVVATGCARDHDRAGETVIPETFGDIPECECFWPKSGKASEAERMRAEIRWLRDELAREGARANG